MLVRIVTASRRGRSAPIGTPALIAWTAAAIIACPPRACTLTSCTPGIAAEESTAPATVFGMSWNFRSRKMPGPSAEISFTAAGPAAVKSWLPILNMPTRSAICFANLRAVDSESKSSATIKLLRGWASKLKVIRYDPEFGGVRVSVAILAVPGAPGSRRNGLTRFFGLHDRTHQFRALPGRDRDH